MSVCGNDKGNVNKEQQLFRLNLYKMRKRRNPRQN